VDFDLISTKEYFFNPIIEPNINRRKSNVRKQSYIGKGLVETPPKGCDNYDFFGVKFPGVAARST
jgi:hypothetical protein